jgi:hypothetical protein
MTDYIVFIHGVNTRETRESPHYADSLFHLIQCEMGSSASLKSIPLYWGDANLLAEQKSLEMYKQSPTWSQLYFRDIREKQLLQFTGDAALYISRNTGTLVVNTLRDQLSRGLAGYQPETDRLHLVTHSMGTVILFDLLFSSRWDTSQTNGYEGAEQLRDLFFGLPPHECEGIRLGSIATMGSPISIYSLMMAPDQHLPTTHDITDRLAEMLQALQNELGKRLPWQNFIHPADIIAYPLAELLPAMVDPQKRYLDVIDILTNREYASVSGSDDLSDGHKLFSHFLGGIMNTVPLTGQNNALSALKKAGELAEKLQMALLCGPAHGSYWASQQVAHDIAANLQAVGRQTSSPQATYHS